MNSFTQVIMDIGFIMLFSILFLVNFFFFKKKIFHPSVLFSTVWFGVITLHFISRFTLLPKLFPLSLEAYSLFFFGALFFTIGSVYTTLFQQTLVSRQPIGNSVISSKLRIILLGVCTLGVPFFIQSSFKAFLASQVDDFFVGLRNELSYGDTDIGPTKYLVSLSFIIFATNLVAYFKNKTITNRILIWLSFVVAIVYAIFSTGRTFFLYIIIIYIGVSYVLNTKFRLRFFLGLIPVFLIFFILFGMIFGKGGDFEGSFSQNLKSSSETTAIYVVSPLSAFDYEIHQPRVLNYPGENTLRFFYIIGESLGLVRLKNFNKSLIQDFVFIPYENNVFTIYSPFIKDAGAIYSFLFLLLIGIFHSVIHNKAVNLKSNKFTVYYALLLYPLIMSFFQEQYLTLISTWLQFIFYVEFFFFLNNRFFSK